MWPPVLVRLRLTCEVRSGAAMARRTFDVIDLIELYEHWWAGRSHPTWLRLVSSCGVDLGDDGADLLG